MEDYKNMKKSLTHFIRLSLQQECGNCKVINYLIIAMFLEMVMEMEMN